MNRRVVWMSAFLVAQIAVFYAYPQVEDKRLDHPLSSLPETLGDWQTIRDVPLTADEIRLLAADETLNRDYRNVRPGAPAEPLNLMSAYFKSQRGGVSPHSPKVCLLGGGWVPTESGTMPITIDGREIRVNRYILSKDGNENFLLYWFAPQRKIYANEYAAKMDTLARSFIRHRNDTAFVRVIVPIPSGKAAEAEQVAVSFVQANFDRLNRMFPQ